MVPSPQQSHKHHHHDGGAVCPSYGVVSMDTPNQMQVTDGGETAQVKGRADKAWAVAHADLGLHVARLMRAAVGGG